MTLLPSCTTAMEHSFKVNRANDTVSKKCDFAQFTNARKSVMSSTSACEWVYNTCCVPLQVCVSADD